jgi:hypothetical protein
MSIAARGTDASANTDNRRQNGERRNEQRADLARDFTECRHHPYPSSPTLVVRTGKVRISIGSNWRREIQSCFLGGDQSERAPVEIGIAAGDSRDQPVSNHVD